MKETYLGDGLYASFDGWHIKLRAPDIEGDRVVYLEPPVVDNFLKYLKDIQIVPEENPDANDQ